MIILEAKFFLQKNMFKKTQMFFNCITICKAHSKPGTCHARHDQSKRYFAGHVPGMAVWISNVPVVCKASGRNSNDGQFPSLDSHILHHWCHDKNWAEHGMWWYVWTLLAVPGTCPALAWQYGVDQALFSTTMQKFYSVKLIDIKWKLVEILITHEMKSFCWSHLQF